MTDSIDIALGTAPEVYQLFSYANRGIPLTDVISHGFNQTLERDQFFGSWADAYVHSSGEYRVKITSPTHDVAPYEALIDNYLAAGRIALQTYNQRGIWAPDFQFLLPFGLAMANVQSVQLYHFPPTETFSYSDYLYSPTNRRWECLLAQNGFDGHNNAQVERIVDVVPIAAAGGASKEIEPYNDDFLTYGQAQLRNFLADAGASCTQPVVTYGGPVREWLWRAYEDQISAQLAPQSGKNPLHVLSLVDLEIARGTRTPVLCANHPSMYLYYTNPKAKPREGDFPLPLTIMRQDLIAAGWQAAMSASSSGDPRATLAAMEKRWAADADVDKIMREQNQEFSFAR